MSPEILLDPLILEDGHVRLEPLGLQHAEGLARAGADPSIWTHLPDGRRRSIEDFANLVAEAEADRRAGTALPFAIVLTAEGEDRVVGTTRYMDIRRRHRGLEIGWTFIDPACQRTSVNTRCKRLLLGHAFDRLDMLRVQLKTDLRNLRSQRAIERIGAVREGVHRCHMVCTDGHVRDTVFYSVIRSEWPGVRAGLESRLKQGQSAPGQGE